MKHRGTSRFLRSHGGTAAIEFAMVAAPLLLLVAGIFEYGRLYWTQEALQESATAGARCIAVLQSNCASSGAYSSGSTLTYIQGVANNWGITIPSADITSTNSVSCGGISGFSQVSITYTFKTLIPNLIPIGSSGKSLTVQSCYPNNH